MEMEMEINVHIINGSLNRKFSWTAIQGWKCHISVDLIWSESFQIVEHSGT